MILSSDGLNQPLIFQMQEKINLALLKMAEEIAANRQELLNLNAEDVTNCDRSDISLFDRLFIDNKKIDGMIDSLRIVHQKPSPLYKPLYQFKHENGMLIENKTVPFGTILIVYESRPDVTVEATATALKSGNRILLKGGKEARKSNLFLSGCWNRALALAGLDKQMVRFLDLSRNAFQNFLKEPDTDIDLIIPRGGQKLIDFVNSVANCPVLVSGRGNNFLYVSDKADLQMAHKLIIESKTSKISACNSLDKVLIHKNLPDDFVTELTNELKASQVTILTSPTKEIWEEEFLDKKILIVKVRDFMESVEFINQYSGKHSATIVTNDSNEADHFMETVDCAAVYHNASTRFTDGFQFGLGAEMAISTQKIHHRGPLGIEHLVTNKWYIKGNGQTR